MMKQAPLEAAQACIDRLLAARAQWLRLRRDAAAGGDGGEDRDGGGEEGSEGCGGGAGGGGRRKRWLVPLPPGGLALVACCVQLYPASDYRHAVLSPCALLVAEVLAQEGLPRGRVGLRRTLFLCSQALKLITPSKRFMPELHNTLLRLLAASLGGGGSGGGGSGGGGVGWAGAAVRPRPLSFATLGGPRHPQKQQKQQRQQ